MDRALAVTALLFAACPPKSDGRLTGEWVERIRPEEAHLRRFAELALRPSPPTEKELDELTMDEQAELKTVRAAPEKHRATFESLLSGNSSMRFAGEKLTYVAQPGDEATTKFEVAGSRGDEVTLRLLYAQAAPQLLVLKFHGADEFDVTWYSSTPRTFVRKR